MTLTISGARSELGRVLSRHPLPAGADAVHVNLAGQQANTLLHDGHAWRDFPRTVLSATKRALRTASQAKAGLFVHASFAFVRAVEDGAVPGGPLQDCVDAILECEALVRAAPLPTRIVRLGYLYGPESADLLAYRAAFKLGRPYWSGVAGALQHHLHLHDAAAALLAAARTGRPGKTCYATDDELLSFRRFMDGFAHRVGRAHPLHLPLRSRLLARLLIREEHMQQTALPMPPGPARPRAPGWKPRYPDSHEGLDQVIEAWRDAAGPQRA